MPQDRMDFLVIGAQKCATSWLYDCLKEHADIHLPAKKKEVEYLGGDLYEQNGADWYFGLVAGAEPGQEVGDVSVNYMSDPRSPALVQQYLPGVKLIACLRDPIDRAVSSYFWYSRKDKIPDLGVEEGLAKAVDPKAELPSEVREAYDDILRRGFYDDQIARYRAFVPPDRMHYVLYDDVSKDPGGVLRSVFRFLGVDEGFLPASISSQPKKNSYYAPLIALERLAPKSRVAGKVLDLANQMVQRTKLGNEKPTLPPHVVRPLIDLYRPHILRTESLINETRKDPVDLTRLWLEKWRV